MLFLECWMQGIPCPVIVENNIRNNLWPGEKPGSGQVGIGLRRCRELVLVTNQ